MTSRLVMWIGVGQLVNWGVLYYAFGVLLIPVQRTLGAPQWVVAGAFSLALLISAALAPTIGHWIDRGRGPFIMTTGGFAAAALLAVWAAVPSVAMMYVVWAGLGLCMAAVLYEPAFAMVGRFIANPADRLRSLAVVTVFGGLASTAFLPTTAMLVRSLEWRGAVGVLAALVALTTVPVSRAARAMARHSPGVGVVATTDPVPARSTERPAGFGSIVLVFASATFAHAALTTTLVSALAVRGIPATTAALLGSLMGLMQVFGRTLLMHGSLSGSPARLTVISLALQAAGMALLAAAPSTPFVGVAIAVFATGSGLTTLVRPYLVQTTFAIERSGYLNGLLARAQQLARAAGPIAAVAIGSAAGYRALFVLFAVHFTVLALTWRAAANTAVAPRERTPVP